MNAAPYYDDGDVTLHHGDALTVARTMPAGSVQTIVTSPPYFGLRDYLDLSLRTRFAAPALNFDFEEDAS